MTRKFMPPWTHRGSMKNYCGIRYIFNSCSKHSLAAPMCQTLGYLYKGTKGICTREYVQWSRRNKRWPWCLPGPRPALPPHVVDRSVFGQQNSTGTPSFVKLEGLSLISLKEPSHLLRGGSKFHEREPFVSSHKKWVKEEAFFGEWINMCRSTYEKLMW